MNRIFSFWASATCLIISMACENNDGKTIVNKIATNEQPSSEPREEAYAQPKSVDMKAFSINARLAKPPVAFAPFEATVELSLVDSSGNFIDVGDRILNWSVITTDNQDVTIEKKGFNIRPYSKGEIVFQGASKLAVDYALRQATYRIDLEDQSQSNTLPEEDLAQLGHGISGLMRCSEIKPMTSFKASESDEVVPSQVTNLNGPGTGGEYGVYSFEKVADDLSTAAVAIIPKNQGNQAGSSVVLQLQVGALYLIKDVDRCYGYYSIPPTSNPPSINQLNLPANKPGSYPCSEEGKIWSLAGGSLIENMVIKKPDIQDAKLYWIDFAGERSEYSFEVSLGSFEYHPWMVTDGNGQCLSIKIPGVDDANSEFVFDDIK